MTMKTKIDQMIADAATATDDAAFVAWAAMWAGGARDIDAVREILRDLQTRNGRIPHGRALLRAAECADHLLTAEWAKKWGEDMDRTPEAMEEESGDGFTKSGHREYLLHMRAARECYRKADHVHYYRP